ncbi:beta-1 3-galactosyltransferase 5 [Biomphalaria pfeifferi]|uniref:Hexosyltransferase n=1 Tax=Biomphalaria pfeifferi TaxID=112525 RepID=A0AAD8B2I1_BIOPF|nr:beta-1 3-galactosyltransferase 5 [Biomphalaria pfeifferi]
MNKQNDVDCFSIFRLPVFSFVYFRRRYLRRSLSFLAAIFTIIFILKIQRLISDLDDVQGAKAKVNLHWSLTKVVSAALPVSSEDKVEQEKARLRFAEFGVDLIPVQRMDPESGGRYFANIQVLHVNESILTSEGGDERPAHRARDEMLRDSERSLDHVMSLDLSITPKPGNQQVVSPGSLYLTILVLSRASNVLMRQAIRKTWGLDAHDMGTCVRFVVGHEDTWDQIVEREQRMHNDVIAVDEEDTYEYLPNKVFDGISWILQQVDKPKFVMKVDDDTFVNLLYLLHELHKGIINSTQILGAICVNATVIRDSGDKWAVSFLDYPFPVFPTYANGGGYVMTLNAASLLVEARSRTFDWLHLEDVYITGMLAMKAGLSHVKHPGFSYWSSPKAKPCDFVLNKRILSVNHTEKEFYRMYTDIQELIQSKDVNLRCKPEKIRDIR